MLHYVIIPSALPGIFVELRYASGLAWAMIIAAEMLGGRIRLGYLLTRSQELLLADQLSLVVIIIGFIIDLSLRRLERPLLKWQPSFR